jgi:hypothetical protein
MISSSAIASEDSSLKPASQPRDLVCYDREVADDVRRLRKGFPVEFPVCRGWELGTGDWELSVAPPRDLVGYPIGLGPETENFQLPDTRLVTSSATRRA